MQEITADDLPSPLQEQLKLASDALKEGYCTYTMALTTAITKTYPGCYEARKTLHQAAALLKKKKSWDLLNPLKLLFSNSLRSIERRFLKHPKNLWTLKKYAAIAKKFDMPQTRILVHESIYALKPTLENALSLGDLYLEAEMGQEALDLGESILPKYPADHKLSLLLQRASVKCVVYHTH